MMRKPILLLLSIIITAQMVYSKEYNLEKIIQLAEKNNKEIKLARSELKFASAQMKEAISTALPKIDVDFGYNRNFLENIFYFTISDSTGKPQTQSFKASFKNEYRFNATLNQTIYGFGKVGNAIKGAKEFKKLTNYQYDSEWQRVITNVKKAFYQALLLQKVWDVAVESENSARENYENLKTKYESGIISEFDLLQSEVRWENSIPETMKARKNYELSLNNLKALVEIPFKEEITLKGNFETYPSLPDSVSVEDVFALRPDYNALLWEKKLRERNVKLEFSNHLPTLLGNLTYTYGAQSDRFRLDNDNDNVIMGLSLRIPVFSGGFTSAQVQKAKVDVEKVKTRIQMVDDNIRIEMQNIVLRMQEAYQRIIAAGKSVNTARRAFEIAESRTDSGLATQLELKDSRVFLDQAQLNYYSAIYDYLDAFFDWEKASGKVSKGLVS